MEGVTGVGEGEGQNIHVDNERSRGWSFCCCCFSCCCSGAKRCDHCPLRGSRWVDVSRIVFNGPLDAGYQPLHFLPLIPDPSTCTLHPQTRTLQPRLDVEERHSRGCAGLPTAKVHWMSVALIPPPEAWGPIQAARSVSSQGPCACGPSMIDLGSSLDVIRSGLRPKRSSMKSSACTQ